MCILKNPVPKNMLRNYAVLFFTIFLVLQHVSDNSLFEISFSQVSKNGQQKPCPFSKISGFYFYV